MRVKMGVKVGVKVEVEVGVKVGVKAFDSWIIVLEMTVGSPLISRWTYMR